MLRLHDERGRRALHLHSYHQEGITAKQPDRQSTRLTTAAHLK
jgi:hypothetical protein